MKYVLILLITFIVVWPALWMIQGSFQEIEGFYRIPPKVFPSDLTLINYKLMLSNENTMRWVLNTGIVMALTCTLAVFLVSTAGYAFGVYTFRGDKFLFWLFMAALMIPANAVIIGKFLVTRAIGLNNTLWAAVLPVAFSPFSIFFYRNYVRSIPTTLIDSARIDGAGELRILATIMFPLCLPAAGVVILFSSLSAFGNFMWHMIVLQPIELKTLLVGLTIQSRMPDLWYGAYDMDPISLRLAGGVIIMIPSLIIFIIANKKFIRDLKMGAMTK